MHKVTPEVNSGCGYVHFHCNARGRPACRLSGPVCTGQRRKGDWYLCGKYKEEFSLTIKEITSAQ